MTGIAGTGDQPLAWVKRDFLPRPGELIEGFARLTVIAFEQGEVAIPRPAAVQRIAAIAGPLGRLPLPAGLGRRHLKE